MTSADLHAPTARRRLAAAVGAVLLAAWLGGCAADPAPERTPSDPSSSSTGTSAAAPSEADDPASSARVGKAGKTERATFVPEVVVLPGDAEAPVQPAATVDGQLMVPENVGHVGWWDGSASAGDPFGSTVIAGHVDAANGATGFFQRLERMKKGDVVTLRGDQRRLSYRVSSVQDIPRRALADDSRAFDQGGDHRLVLITCTGDYIRSRGGYQKNLVVTATPIGLPR